LGLATAAHLYRRGWTVLAAMRGPDEGLKRLAERVGSSFDERRLIGIQLDLTDPASIDAAAATILDEVGAPDGIVHNAGVAGAGAVEEMPVDVVEDIFRTNLFGPIHLTRQLLPAMRSRGEGRIVVVSSQAGLRGVPATSAYSASKSALERWAESLSMELAPFGLGVSVLVTGTFKTDILELTPTWKEPNGPYAPLHEVLEAAGDKMRRLARSPERFAVAVESSLMNGRSFSRRPVGVDAALMLYGRRLLPDRAVQALTSRVLRLPRT
jgi:NAD(P)-dependent dehydrogenase (short-subunit alcohol dehydrogenase family)